MFDWTKVQDWLFTVGFRLVLVLGLTILVLIVVRLISRRIVNAYKNRQDDVEHQKRAATLGQMLRWVLTTAILFTGALLFLEELGIEIGPLLAAAGVAGIAIGFGVQHLVQDFANGFFIMINDEVRVGDVVSIAGQSGLVERVTLRQIVLRALDGNVHYVPNGKIDIVTNMTKEYSYCLLNVGVAYREDIDEVMSVMEQVAEQLKDNEEIAPFLLEPIEILGLDQFGDSAIIVKARIKVRPITQWKVMRAYNRLLKIAFDKADIEIPFPHLTVYPGVGKDGEAPGLHVKQVNEQSGA